MFIYYYIMSAFVTAYLQMYMHIYTVVVPPIGLYTDFLLVSNFSMMDVLILHIWILYYMHNIVLLTKQKLEFMYDVNNMVIINKR